MAATVFEHPDELKAAVGSPLGVSEWLEIDQKRIDLFAEATAGAGRFVHDTALKARPNVHKKQMLKPFFPHAIHF